MKTCVDSLNRKSLPGDIRLKTNKPKDDEAKARSSAFWQGKQLLIKHGWLEGSLSISRGRVWDVSLNGEARCLGSMVDGRIVWEEWVKTQLKL